MPQRSSASIGEIKSHRMVAFTVLAVIVAADRWLAMETASVSNRINSIAVRR